MQSSAFLGHSGKIIQQNKQRAVSVHTLHHFSSDHLHETVSLTNYQLCFTARGFTGTYCQYIAFLLFQVFSENYPKPDKNENQQISTAAPYRLLCKVSL